MLIKSMRAVLKSIFNPGKYRPGMEGLIKIRAISQIKLTEFMTAPIILADASAAAKKKQDESNTPNIAILVTIINYAGAMDEANQTNQITQAVISAKQATTKVNVTFVDTAITNHILCTIDSKDLKTINKYMLVNLTNAIKQGAERPPPPNILEQLVTILTYNFDMHLKVKTNIERLRTEATKVDAYGGIGVTELQIALVVLANMDVVIKEAYGCEFCHTIHEIFQKYPYSYKHAVL